MGMTTSGAMCDVCDNFILSIDPDERINLFGMPGIENQMMSCNKCTEVLKKLNETKNWKGLPDGRLKRFIEENKDKIQKEV